MIKFLRRFVFSFNILAIILLFGSYFSVFISPAESWVFAFLGLAYPFMLFLNVFFAIFWLVQLKLKALFSIGAILVGFTFIQQTFQFHRNEDKQEDKKIVVVSYNAGLFGYFQSRWYMQEMVDKLKEVKPDILCLQEVLNLKHGNTSTIDSIRNLCGFKYVYFQKLEDGRKKGEYGMAIFSRFRIRDNKLVNFDGLTGNMCVYADVEINKLIYRVYNVHLQSFKFKKQDYKFITKMPDDNEEKIRQSKGMLKRMKYAYSQRASQVDKIREDIVASAHPHFVIGDFNDPPVSYSYATLSRRLRDAFVENGFGMGKTYIGLMPNFRIDYILYPDDFSGLSYQAHKLSSDHSMIETGIKLTQN